MPTYFLVQTLKRNCRSACAELGNQLWVLGIAPGPWAYAKQSTAAFLWLISSLGIAAVDAKCKPLSTDPPTFPFAAAHCACCESRSQNTHTTHQPQWLLSFGVGITDSSPKKSCVWKWKWEDKWDNNEINGFCEAFCPSIKTPLPTQRHRIYCPYLSLKVFACIMWDQL